MSDSNATTYNKILFKGIEANLPVTIGENELKFTIDTGRLFLDNEGTDRVEITDFIKGMTKNQILNNLAPLPKFYLASDTQELYYYDTTADEWKTINAGSAVNASTAEYAINAGTSTYATNASTADYATNAGTATYATNASTADYSTNASTAEYATNAGTATYSTNAGTATNASTADYSINAGSATYATNASTADYSTNAGTADVAVKDGSGNIITNTYAPLASPLFTGTPTVPDVEAGDSSSKIANTKYVDTAINNLPEPMIYKGTVGAGGTITDLPNASTANEGYTYKVITAGTYDSQPANVGDVFTSNATSWVLFPGGDPDTDTWRNIKVNGTEKLGSGISSGALDIINGNNTTATFDGTNKTLQIDSTDINVTQTEDTSDAEYEVLLSNNASTATETDGVKKSEFFKYNPSKKAFTFGTRANASTVGNYSHAEGFDTIASGNYSHAEGSNVTASGARSHAEGYITTASGPVSHAEGFGTIASGSFGPHAEGNASTASGNYSHAEGKETTASGFGSHAEGKVTTANHASQHVFGEYNISDASTATANERGTYVEIVGNGNSSTASNARTLDWDGNETIAGQLTDKFGKQSIRRISEEDYQLLSTEEKNDGTIYHRYNASGAASFNNKVTQTENTTDANYEVLLSNNASTATEIDGVNKSSGMTFNPNTGNLNVDGVITVGTAPTANMDVATKKYVDDAIDEAITQVLVTPF